MDEFEFGWVGCWFLPPESCGDDDMTLSDDVITGFATDCVDNGEIWDSVFDDAWGGDVVFDASTEKEKSRH